MKLADGENQLGSYTHKSRREGDSIAILTNRRLQIARGGIEENYPRWAITSVILSFQRRRGDITSAIVLLLFLIGFASALAWTQSNMTGIVNSVIRLAADFGYDTAQQTVMQQQMQARGQTLLVLYPVFWGLAALGLLYALWLGFTGIRGETRMLISFLDGQQELKMPGNNAALLEFGQTVAQSLR